MRSAGDGEAMSRYNGKDEVRAFYDRLSPHCPDFWGAHLHHGYWITGEETKERAQIQLMEHLAHLAGLEPGFRILDVGCGFGGSSIYLAKKYGADATGITISPIQVEMARKAAAGDGVKVKFIEMDAQEMKFDQPFDVVWSMESISHYQQKEKFFAAAVQCLKSRGTVAITDWFKREGLTQREYQKSIQPIEKAMLIEMETMEDYAGLLRSNGLEIMHNEILNENCIKTWDFCMDMLKKKALWRLAAQNGSQFLEFLRAFRVTRAGFASGNFIYGLLVAKKM
jgi:tocopherol O-methyltransferase